MTTRQESKLKMYLSVRIYLLANPTITAKLPNFELFMAALDSAILQIQTNSELSQYNTKGVTNNKQQLRETVIMLTVDASAKMQAFAKFTQDTVLLSETKFLKTTLNNASSLALADISNGLANRIDLHLDAVTAYGLTAATQTQYRAAIDAFVEAIPKPRQSQLKSKENTLLEAQGFVAADDALDNIDTLVEITRQTEQVFYTGYRNARKIVDQGTGSLQVQGVVTEAANGKQIPYATLVFKLNGQEEVITEKETAAKGGFMIKSLPEGIYDITVSKVGFKPQTITTTVRWDELCNVVVELEKL